MQALAKILCGAVAFLVVTQSAFAQDAIQLRYKFEKGKKYNYSKNSEVKQTQTVKDMKIETDINTAEASVWTVQDVDNKGNLTIQTENKELSARIKIGPLGELNFDSKDKSKNKSTLPGADQLPIFERVAGAKLTLTLTPQGKVNEVKGYKELMADVLKDNPLAEQLVGGGTEEAAKTQFAEFIPYLKEQPVQPGDKWEVPFEIKLPKIGGAKGKKIYWYQGDSKVGNRKTAKINVSSEMNFDLNLEMGGAKVTGKMSITSSKGTIEFDPKEGCLVSLNNEFTLSGNLNVAVNGMDIPVTTEQVQNFSMKLMDGSAK